MKEADEREFMIGRTKELRSQLKDFILDNRDKKRALATATARIERLEAALLSIENGCTVTADWEVEDHVRDVIEACRCTARDALADGGEGDGNGTS